jgi:uncharacterized protein (DUF2235 family)
MGRKIILLSDGTGNSSAKVWRTNVWRTYEALDLSGNDQVAFYDDGVGTSSFKPWAVLGGAFGFGLRRNVIALYKFACRNYHSADDELFGFGFSRGAFTIRIVMGLIDSQGLVQATDEAELDSLAKAAYRAYRKDRYRNLKLERPYQWIRNKFGPHYPPAGIHKNIKNIKVRFVGVWDTVAAYGMPVEEMTRGIHQYLWPIELPDNKLSRSVARACQALALDEERTTFHPQLWHEGGSVKADPSPGAAIQPTRFIKDERISQVWFAGVHSNVGGGYPDDSLAYIPFVWMITEAQRCGLRFKSDHAGDPDPDVMRADPDTFKNAISKRDKDGKIYDPRKGLGGYYRYGPRKLVPDFYPALIKHEDDEVIVGRAKIHESVFRRIRNQAHAYAPIGLPQLYDVVREDGAIVTPDQYGCETSARAVERAKGQEHVWNEVWKRRLVYFGSVGATIWLLVFPLISGSRRVDEFTNPFRWISDIIRTATPFLPGFAKTWVDGYARAPRSSVLLAVLVCFFLVWGTTIAARIANRMAAIWNRGPSSPTTLPTDWIYTLRSNPYYIRFHEGLKRRWAPVFFAMMFVYLGASIASHLFYNIQDVGGLTCKDHDTDPSLPAPTLLLKGQSPRIVTLNTNDLCFRTGILLARGATYNITLDTIEPWRDSGVEIPTGGFSAKQPPTWYQRIFLSLGVPLRRELFEDWGRIVLRYGRVGGEEAFLEPDPDDPRIESAFRPTRNGELFVFVNDAVIGIPGLYDVLYLNNLGSAKVTVTRTK